MKVFNLIELKSISTESNKFLVDETGNDAYRYILKNGHWILYDTDFDGAPTVSYRMSKVIVDIINVKQ